MATTLKSDLATGTAPALNDLIGGHVDVLIASAPSIYQQVKAGSVRGLGVTSKGRSPVVPDLPPLATMGVPSYSFELWWGILAPPKTPPEVVAQINADVNKILATPEMKEAFMREGAEPDPWPPKELADEEPLALLDSALGPLASADTRQTISRAESRAQALTLLVMSPEFLRS